MHYCWQDLLVGGVVADLHFAASSRWLQMGLLGGVAFTLFSCIKCTHVLIIMQPCQGLQTPCR